MRKHVLSGIAILVMAASGAYAADQAQPAAKTAAPAQSAATDSNDNSHMGKDWTLDEARRHAHESAEKAKERADKLDKMTESEWAEHLKKRHAFLEKMKKMTPEDRKEYWKKRKEWREHHEAENSTANPSENNKPSDTAPAAAR